MRFCFLVAATVLFCADASAQEVICDPENPACGQQGELEPIADEPDASVEPQPTDDLEPASAPESSNSGFDSARFLGAWGTRLDVDSSFDGHREDIVELSSSLGLGLQWAPTQRLRVVVMGEFRHWIGGRENPEEVDLLLNATDVRAAFDARLGEAYVSWTHDFGAFAVGNQVVRWGSTDLVRPGDVLNPVDRTTLSAFDAAQRLPQLTADLTLVAERWALQGVVVPFFVPDRTWAFGRDFALLDSRNPVVREQFPIDGLLDELIDNSIQDDVQPLVTGTRVPDETPSNVSVGVRGTATFLNTDIGLGWWRGWDRTPFIYADPAFRTLLTTILEDGQVLEDFDFLAFFLRNPELVAVSNDLSERAAAGEDVFFSEYRRLQMVLLDGARYFGPIGVRADVAFFPRKTYLTESFQAVRRPTFAPALGLSWERLESEDDLFTVTLEGFWNKPFAADEAITEAFVPADLRGSPDDELLIIGDGLYGVSGALLWTLPLAALRLQLGGVYNISHGDVIASAALSRQFLDTIEISAGYTMLAGPDPRERLTLGGIYDDNDQLSFGVSGIF